MKQIRNTAVALISAAILSGCAGAAFNRVNLTMHRNITFGQELLDLQAAHEKGVISDTEYMQAKQNLLNLVSTLGSLDAD